MVIEKKCRTKFTAHWHETGWVLICRQVKKQTVEW